MPQTSELPRTSWFGATLAMRTLYLIAMVAFFASAESVASRSFTVKNDTFVKDGHHLMSTYANSGCNRTH